MKQNPELVADLKSSHFDFGNYNTQPNHSVYYNNFRPSTEKNNTAVIDNKNRKSHINFGNYENNNFYVSLKDRDFQNHGPQEIARLDDEKKRDLRRHHFTYGGWDQDHSTTAGSTYCEQKIDMDVLRNKMEKTNKMRRHNFELGMSEN